MERDQRRRVWHGLRRGASDAALRFPGRRAAASKPGTVIISGGWNDVARGVPTATIVEGLRETPAAVTKHVPEARVVVIAPIGPASSPPPDLVRLRDAAAPVVRSSGAAWLDLDFPLTGHRE